jgi:hypothetical protein
MTIKKTLFVFSIFLISTFLYGQEFRISIAPTINDIFHYSSVQGGPHGSARMGFYTQIDYLFLKEKKFRFGIGLNYLHSNVGVITPYFETHGYSEVKERTDLISLCLETVFNLKKHFYLCMAPTVEVQSAYDPFQSIDDQSGIGLSFGIGKEIKLKEALFLNVEPRLWVHNIVPFQHENIPFRLTTAGLNLGLVFGKNTEH